MNFRVLTLATVLASMTFASGVAHASHFRGGAVVPSVDANGLVTFTATTFWRPGGSPFPVSGVTTEGSRSFVGGSNYTVIDRVIDSTDSRFTRVLETFTFQLSGAGTYDFKWQSCCRVGQIANATESWNDLDARIVWDGVSANAPILFDFAAINPEVVRGQDYNNNLGATSGSGLNLSYNQDLNINITSQPAPSFTVDPATGQLSITAADTANMVYDNPFNEGADYAFSGNIIAADGSFVEFDWLFDAVDTGSQNLAPVVNDMVINALVGDLIDVTVTGFDPDGDPLTWDLLSLFGPGDTSAFSFDPLTQQILWDTSGVAEGTYIANIRASDGSLTDVGTVRIILASGTGPVPVREPATLGLLGLALMGLGLARRRKAKTGA